MSDILPGLRPRRKAAGMTLQDVAEAMGCSINAVALWERGESLPTVDRLPKLAEVLGCTVDELYKEYNGKGDTRP